MSQRKPTRRPKLPMDHAYLGESGPRRPPSESWAANAEDSLVQKLIAFSTRRSLATEFERALKLYHGWKSARGQTLDMDDPEFVNFNEWYLHDFALSDGQRLIDRFAEENSSQLPPAEAQLLAAWQQIERVRLFEIQSVQPEVGIVVRDLLSEEEFTIQDRSASRTASRWLILVARLHQTLDRVCLTGNPRALSPREKPELVAFARRLWETYRAERPQAGYAEFYRDRSLELWRETKRLQEEANRSPVPVTREGHPLVLARAEFTVRDGRAVAEKLAAAEEFETIGPSEEYPGALHFDWYLRGRSHISEQTDLPKNAVMLDLQALQPDSASPGPQVRTLGDVFLWPTRLELSCMSRERLAAGKTLLVEILGDLVRPYKRDRLEPIDLDHPGPLARAASSRPQPKPAPRLSRAEQEALMRRMAEEQTLRWLEEPIPALEGQSPRQAMQTPAGQAKVLDLIKYMEFMDDQRPSSPAQGFGMDLARVRRELGLPAE
jgi:hypothetical protein